MLIILHLSWYSLIVFQSLHICCYTYLRLPDYSLLEVFSKEIVITFTDITFHKKRIISSLYFILNVFSIRWIKNREKKKKSNEEKVYFMQKGKQNSISTFDKNPQSLKTSPKPFQNWKYPPSKEKLFCTSTKSISVKKAKSFADDTSLFLRTLWY